MSTHSQVEVTVQGKQKLLRFASAEIQSLMSILHPDALTLDYTRLMMGFLLFQNTTSHLLMIGLGGGSILKFCRRYLPLIDVTSVEISEQVIALREEFHIPPDDDKHRIIHDDGAHFVAETKRDFDVILVDGFDSLGIPEQLGSLEFYQHCYRCLTHQGILIVNLHINHQHAEYMERLRQVFAGQVVEVLDEDECNSIVFAFKGEDFATQAIGNPKKPASLSKDAWRQLLPEMQAVASAHDLLCP